MNRRNFLKSMGALAAVAVGVPTFTAISKPNKYSESLRLLDACRGIEDATEASFRVDLLIAHLFENFPAPAKSEANIAAVRTMLKTVVDEDGIRGIPPNVADEIYPVALIRLGLYTYGIDINPGRMKLFDQFHKIYGGIIISASYTVPVAIKPKTAQEAQNDILTKFNKETNWSSWEEDVKLYNIKGQA
ncbi:Twin-arginine translocation pathway, signal sequence, bacterial/archaeal [uncultured Caudovirales phage]|uniref:Twin-arginine translocation pathway, signal sequence, bacterial/archaeal n=1 Tax=uncultured Caudovirales phage TaxID=2100421 RepID=A0A6J7WM17_9CAUD|nr:Twin-arginine translocation pathway, signal sequence, bacterial/archaeal [uncultured Caudovirales phage]